MAFNGIRSPWSPVSRWFASVRSRVVFTLGGTDPAGSLTKDEIFDVLRNQRRRAVIRYLLENGGHAGLDDVTEAVAAEEFGKVPAELSSAEYKRVYTGLYQCHLERMEELGVIDVDRTAQTVELRDAADQLARYLPDAPERTRIRAEALGVVGVAIVIALGALGAGPLAAIPPVTWVVVTTVFLIALGIAHTLERQPTS